jgi:amino acid adenylation domain-containing protein
MHPVHGLPIDHGGPTDRTFEPFPYSALEGSILDRFDAVVRRHADRLAVQDAEVGLTYAEVAEQAARIAARVGKAVEGRPGPVAILLPNDARLPGAMLGVLAAGRAFIPLDVDHPLERNRVIADQAGAAAVLTSGDRAGEIRARLGHDTAIVDIDVAMATPGERPAVRPAPDDLAYILYTSGSTGAPKGVCHSHRNCLHDTLVAVNNVHLTCEDRLSLFYASVVGAARRTFASVLSGASLHIMPPGDRGAAELARDVRARGITYMHEVPTLFRRIAGALEPGERLESLRVVRLSGDRSEWNDYDLFKRACPPGACFGVNLGCTEVPSTYAHWYVDEAVREPGGRLPVGREMDNVAVTVVGPEGQPLPDGEIGEFRVASRHLALGYWRAPELTAAAFATDPADPDVRVYRTGDMGFRRPDGLLEFVGRKDQMVKLRGHRIEPAEVEAALRTCDGVADAGVVIRRDEAGVARALAAYAELKPGAGALMPRHLMAMLSRVLPGYLMPSALATIEALPRLMNFKIDRPALERLDAERAARDKGRADDPLLDKVATAFEAIVPGARATPEDNLLSLGGDSLQAVELALELKRVFGLEIPRKVLRQTQSIRDLTGWIAKRLARTAAAPAD